MYRMQKSIRLNTDAFMITLLITVASGLPHCLLIKLLTAASVNYFHLVLLITKQLIHAGTTEGFVDCALKIEP